MRVTLQVSLPLFFILLIVASFTLGFLPVTLYGLQVVDGVAEDLAESISWNIAAKVEGFLSVPVGRVRGAARHVSRRRHDAQVELMVTLVDMAATSAEIVYSQLTWDGVSFYGVESSQGAHPMWHVRNATLPSLTSIPLNLSTLAEAAPVATLAGFLPSTRPWYLAASPNCSWTAPYKYSDGSKVGITASIKLEDGGVLAADVTTDSLSVFLRNLKYSSSGVGFLVEQASQQVIAVSWNESVHHQHTSELSFKTVSEFQHHLVNRLSQQDIVSLIAPQKDRVVQHDDLLIGVRFIADYNGLQMTALVIIPESDLSGKLFTKLKNLIVLIVCSFVVLATLGACVSMNISSRIKATSRCMEEAAVLKYDVEPPEGMILSELILMWESFAKLLENIKCLHSFLPRSVMDELEVPAFDWTADAVMSGLVQSELQCGASRSSEESFPLPNLLPTPLDPIRSKVSFVKSLGTIGIRHVRSAGVIYARGAWNSTDPDVTHAVLREWVLGVTEDMKVTTGTMEAVRGEGMLVSFGAMGNPNFLSLRVCRSIMLIMSRANEAARLSATLNFTVCMGADQGPVQAGTVGSDGFRVRCIVGSPVQRATTLCSACELYHTNNLVAHTVQGWMAKDTFALRPVTEYIIPPDTTTAVLYTLVEKLHTNDKRDSLTDAWALHETDKKQGLSMLHDFVMKNPTDRMAQDMYHRVKERGRVADVISVMAVPVNSEFGAAVTRQHQEDTITDVITTYLVMQRPRAMCARETDYKAIVKNFHRTVVEEGGIPEGGSGIRLVARWEGDERDNMVQSTSCAIRLSCKDTGIGLASGMVENGILQWNGGSVHAVMGSVRCVAESLAGMALAEDMLVVAEGAFATDSNRVWMMLCLEAVLPFPSGDIKLRNGLAQLCIERPPHPAYSDALRSVSYEDWVIAENVLQDIVNNAMMQKKKSAHLNIEGARWIKKLHAAVSRVRKDPLIEHLVVAVTSTGAVFDGEMQDLFKKKKKDKTEEAFITNLEQCTSMEQVLLGKLPDDRPTVQKHLWGNFNQAAAAEFAKQEAIVTEKRPSMTINGETVEEGDQEAELFRLTHPQLYCMFLVVRLSALFYLLFVTPYKAVFLPTDSFDFSLLMWLCFDYLCDLTFYMNIVHRFSMPFVEHGILVTNKARIKQNYLETDFVKDVVSVIPHELVWFSVFKKASLLHSMRLNRLVAIYEVKSLIEQVNDILGWSEVVGIFVVLTLMLCCILFWIGCLWQLLVVNQQDDRDTDRYTGAKGFSDSNTFHQALYAFYWACRSFSGFGTAYPQTIAETAICLFTACFGIMLFATAIAYMQQLLIILGSNELVYQSKIDTLLAYSEYVKLHKKQEASAFGENVVDECIDFLRIRYERTAQVYQGQYNFLSSELPLQLGKELEYYANLNIVSKFSELQLTNDPEFAAYVVSAMRPVFLCRGEVLLQKRGQLDSYGEVPGVYFFQNGCAVAHLSEQSHGVEYWEKVQAGEKVYPEPVVVEWLEGGSYWGETNLIFGCVGQVATVEILVHSEVYMLPCDAFRSLQSFPVCLQPFYQTARERIEVISEYTTEAQPRNERVARIALIGESILKQNHYGMQLLNKFRKRSKRFSKRGTHDFFSATSANTHKAPSTVDTQLSKLCVPDNIPSDDELSE